MITLKYPVDEATFLTKSAAKHATNDASRQSAAADRMYIQQSHLGPVRPTANDILLSMVSKPCYSLRVTLQPRACSFQRSKQV